MNETELNEVYDAHSVEKNESVTEDTSSNIETQFIDDSNSRAFELLNLKTKIKDIQSLSDNIKKGSTQWLSDTNDDEIENLIDAKLETLTEAEISALTNEDIDNLLTFDDIEVKFSIDFHGHKNEELKFKRDFLIYRKKSNIAIAEFDKEMEKISAEIAECQEEFNDIVSKYQNINNLIRSTIAERIENAQTDDHKKLYMDIRDNFEYSFTLDNFKEYVSSYKLKNIVSDFVIYKRSMKILNKYKKMMTKMKIKDDITKFTNIEKKIIGDEYSGRSNIVMFAMMHFIASQSNNDNVFVFGLFVTQFIVNMKNFIFDKFDDENDKETFISALKDVIDIIG